MATAINTVRDVRDATIGRCARAAEALLLSDESGPSMEKAVNGLDRILTAMADEVEGLSSSNRGYAHRDLDEATQTNLAKARGFVAKLRVLHGPQVTRA